MRKSTYLLTFWASLVLISVCLMGCSTITNIQKNSQDKKDATEQKKKHFLALKADIASNTLHKGMTVEAIKATYGAPDDTFYSGSSVSSFQVWTYNSLKDKLADTMLNSIILYIENDKLVNWKY